MTADTTGAGEVVGSGGRSVWLRECSPGYLCHEAQRKADAFTGLRRGDPGWKNQRGCSAHHIRNIYGDCPMQVLGTVYQPGQKVVGARGLRCVDRVMDNVMDKRVLWGVNKESTIRVFCIHLLFIMNL